jgi:ATP-dependent exoDNAse (exonuclease V) alpha subunit
VLVGDPKQPPEIDAGGMLRTLDQHIGGVDRKEKRRQHEAWEREALTHLREGRSHQALPVYEIHKRSTSEPTANAARDRLVHDYLAAYQPGERVLMVAMRWRDIHELNHRARVQLLDAGRIEGPVLGLSESLCIGVI